MKPKPLSKLEKFGLLSRSDYRRISLLKGNDGEFGAIKEIQEISTSQCLGAKPWPKIEKINVWMISSETATFMKIGGLGMVATELPEAFNRTFSANGDKMTIVTPMYLGDALHKKAYLRGNTYFGSEGRDVEVKKLGVINVNFVGKNRVLNKYRVGVYVGNRAGTDYVFLKNRRFFNITTNYRNPECQDGCYVLNKFGVNEVERFAFFSKCVYELEVELCGKGIKGLSCPNVLLANDWHSGAISGLTKYLTLMNEKAGKINKVLADKIQNIPVIHLAHHLGYQGWDHKNTVKILNSLYGNMIKPILSNAKISWKDNPRIENTLMIDGVYNQACCNFHLADRIVTVSKNYVDEVSKEPDFGYDFCQLLKKRKDLGNFVGIVNGFDKSLISPNQRKIDCVNGVFKGFDFKIYDENSLEKRGQNKKELLRLLAKLAKDADYKKKTLPLINFYKFEDISDLIDESDDIAVFSATSRLVEQKGYDIAAKAIIDILQDKNIKFKKKPIFILGGAGDSNCFEDLMKLKDKVAQKDPDAARRIFVFRGYKDQFAFVIQMASDFYMMPSKFEPCGLSQMEAMAKGSLPIAMSTGGLVDTIEDGVDGYRTEVFFGDNSQVFGSKEDGKKFKTNEKAFAAIIEKAMKIFETNPKKHREMVVNTMRKDFSWDVKGTGAHLYHNLLQTGNL